VVQRDVGGIPAFEDASLTPLGKSGPGSVVPLWEVAPCSKQP